MWGHASEKEVTLEEMLLVVPGRAPWRDARARQLRCARRAWTMSSARRARWSSDGGAEMVKVEAGARSRFARSSQAGIPVWAQLEWAGGY